MINCKNSLEMIQHTVTHCLTKLSYFATRSQHSNGCENTGKVFRPIFCECTSLQPPLQRRYRCGVSVCQVLSLSCCPFARSFFSLSTYMFPSHTLNCPAYDLVILRMLNKWSFTVYGLLNLAFSSLALTYDLRSHKAALCPVVLAFSHRAVSHLCGFVYVGVRNTCSFLHRILRECPGGTSGVKQHCPE